METAELLAKMFHGRIHFKNLSIIFLSNKIRLNYSIFYKIRKDLKYFREKKTGLGKTRHSILRQYSIQGCARTINTLFS